MKHVISLLIFLLSATFVSAGGFSTGTEFYFTFTENLKQDEPQSAHEMTVFIASNYKTTGTIELLGPGKTTTWKQAFSVDSMGVAEITIPTGFNNTTEIVENDDEKPLRHAIHVVAGNPIAVYALNHIKYTTDGFLVIPPSAWGTNYVIASFSGITRTAAFPNIRATSEFALVAAYDNTIVSIALTDNTMVGPTWGVSHAKGTIVNVTLQKGEVYQMQAWKNGSEVNDFSGTIISSNHPVGVISGVKCTDIPVGKQACDHIVEMLPPTDTWGKEYFTYPFEPVNRPTGDLWRCFALDSGTDVRLNGKVIGSIDPQDVVTPYFETDDWTRPELQTAAHWEFSKPVMMCQYICGQDYDKSDHGDPSSVILEPHEQFQRDIVFSCPSDHFGFTPQSSPNGGNYINIVINDNDVAKTGLRDSATLDGYQINNLPAPQYQVYLSPTHVPGTTFWVYHIRIPGGVHHLKAQSEFTAYAAGFRDYESYAWPCALSLKRIGSSDTLPPTMSTNLQCGELSDVIYDLPHDSTKYDLPQFADDGLGIGWLHDAPPNNTFNFDDNILGQSASGYTPGDSLAHVDIKVSNLRQNAHGALYVVDRGGNDTVYQFDYIADTVATSPMYVFGKVSPPATKTLDVMIHNPMNATVTIDSLWLVEHSVFSFSAPGPKFPMQIKKGDSVDVRVLFTPTGATFDVDSIYVKFNCFSRPLTVLTGGMPQSCVAITDLDYGTLTITGATIAKDSTLIITNSGTGPLNISQIDISGPGASAYSLAPAITLPLTANMVIPPLGRDTITVHFSATHSANYSATVHLTTDATCSSKDDSARLNAVVSTEIGIGSYIALSSMPLTFRSIAPNPADAAHVRGSVDINYALGSRSTVSIRICNILGQEMMHVDADMRDAGEWRQSVDISRLVPGAYVVRLAVGRDVASRMLMVK